MKSITNGRYSGGDVHEDPSREEIAAFLKKTTFCVGIRGFIKCVHCASQIPVRHLGDAVQCHRCGNELPTAVAFWRGVTCFDWMAAVHAGKLEQAEFDDLVLHTRLPVCASCEASVSLEGLEQAVDTTSLVCGECGESIVCRPANEAARAIAPGAVLLVGERDPGQKGTGEVKSAKPVVLSCMQCGGTLSVDGSKRLVTCSYCQVDNYLPGEVWLALHPQPVAKDFFIVTQPGDVERWTMALECGWASLLEIIIPDLPSLPEGVAALCARRGNFDVQATIAGRRDTPLDVLEMLFDSKVYHEPVRLAAIGNPALDAPATIMRFVESIGLQEGASCPHHSELNIWRILASNPATPIEIFQRVVMKSRPDNETQYGRIMRTTPDRDDHNRMRAAVAAHSDAFQLPFDCLEVMVRDGDHAVHMALVKNEAATPEILAMLRRLDSTELLLAVAGHPGADEETIRKLSLKDDPQVAEAARRHERYSDPTFWDRFGR